MKRWVNVVGSVFAVIIMAGVLHLYGGDLKSVDLADPLLVAKLGASIATYVSVMVIAAFGWRTTLLAVGAAPVCWSAERQMLISQIGKYVPGNVAQYLGRAAMAVGSGISAKVVAMALVIDTAAIIAGGFLAVTITILFTPHLAASLSIPLTDQWRLCLLGLGIAALFIFSLNPKLVRAASRRFGNVPRVQARWILVALIVYTISFLLLGLSLHFVASALTPKPVPLALSIATFAAGWIAGLVAPGAPGGLGVRESILVLGLAPVLGGPAALSAALLHRGVSVLGDVISFGLGHLMPKYETVRTA